MGALHTSQRAEATAKRLRRKPTLAEQRLWKALKTVKFNGSHFRRQAAFGPYIVDFVCHGARLVVEVDGGVHRLPEVAARDAEREAWLTQRRYAVVRITNEQALFDPYAAVETIAGRAQA